MDFNQKITTMIHDEVLDKKGWTQRKLAAEMGVTESEMSLLLSGKRNWTLRLVSAFVKATGIHINIEGQNG